MDYVIIVAGGKGLRMGGPLPKQFIPVGGKPILMRTLERFREYSADLGIILVLPKDHQEYWKQLCKEYNFTIEHQIADGGETRFHSVKNGLNLIKAPLNPPLRGETDLSTSPSPLRGGARGGLGAWSGAVGVHDGVRPFVSVEVIKRCYEAAHEGKNVVPATAVIETLRHVTEGTKPRSDYRLVQTPQVFPIETLKAAYHQPYTDLFTDDASVIEAMGGTIEMVEGNRENIKVTTPFDLKISEMLVVDFQNSLF